MVRQPLPPFLPPLLSHGILSLLVILPLLLEEFLRTFTLVQTTSSTCLQSQVLSLSLSICSTQRLFLSSTTFALLDICLKDETALLMSCSRRDRVRQIVSNVTQVQKLHNQINPYPKKNLICYLGHVVRWVVVFLSVSLPIHQYFRPLSQ